MHGIVLMEEVNNHFKEFAKTGATVPKNRKGFRYSHFGCDEMSYCTAIVFRTECCAASFRE